MRFHEPDLHCAKEGASPPGVYPPAMMRFILAFCLHICLRVSLADLWKLERRGTTGGCSECQQQLDGRGGTRRQRRRGGDAARFRLVSKRGGLVLEHLGLVNVREHHLHVLLPASKWPSVRGQGAREHRPHRSCTQPCTACVVAIVGAAAHMTALTSSTCCCTSLTLLPPEELAIARAAAGFSALSTQPRFTGSGPSLGRIVRWFAIDIWSIS